MLTEQIKCVVCHETEQVQIHSEEWNRRVCYGCADITRTEEHIYENISVNTEGGTVQVSTPEQAKRIICATLKVHGMELDEVPAFKPIVKLATHFGINLSTLKRTLSTDIGELTYGYPWDYHFEDVQ